MTSFLLQENSFFLLLESNGNIVLQTSGSLSKIVIGPVDIALARQDDGSYDISIDENGDLAQTADIDTAIYMSLLTDKRAASSEVTVPQNRRGWWGNVFNTDPDYEIGSKLWLLEQSRGTQDTLNKAQQYVVDCLQWLITDKYVKGIAVNAELVANGIQVNVKFS